MPDACPTSKSCEASGFLGGRLSLLQPARGHRAGTDAILLAAAAPREFGGLVLDLGAGVGAAGLAIAATRPRAKVGLIEKEPDLAGLAQENLRLNGFSDRGHVYQADILSPASRRAAGLLDGAAALIVTNPPFYDPGRVRLSPEQDKRRAHAMGEAGPAALAHWIQACFALAEPGGAVILIHRPDVLPVILESIVGRGGDITILPVQPRQEAPAIRVLVRAKKGSRAPLVIAPVLVLHQDKIFTPAVEAMHRGDAVIDW
jgi:tRNA1(Val) A37 N6-methylase TrmN6